MNRSLLLIKDPYPAAVFWWRPAAWLRVTGDDAATFLQGQFTNDLRSLTTDGGGDRAIYGLWLNVKGKVVADSFVLRGRSTNEFWLASYFSPAAAIRERLESFVIADDVTIEDVTAAWAAVSLVGPEAMAAAEAAEAEVRDAFVFPGRRARTENREWIFPLGALETVRARLAHVREADAAEMAALRIASDLPAIPADVGPTDLPNEAALERDAISYTKGCYLGQEVMARLKSMGQVRRRLLRVRGTEALGAIPSLPAPLFRGGKRVGELRSVAPDAACGVVGFAMLTLMHVAADAGLALAEDGPETFRLLDAP